ncbi:MAG TPA: hypothetical protein VFW16_12690, partial [Streptosporangiaceae bacterium]|nr:hypothetical protein [Streptosporangiaceae bacterium]
RTGTRVPAGAAAAAGPTGQDSPADEATELVPAARRATGDQGLTRVARGRAARARAAGGGRARGGRAAAAGTPPGADQAVASAEAASLAAAGPRRMPGRRRAGEPDEPPRPGRRPDDGRLAEAWPYAPPDEDRQAGRETGQPEDAWPYAAAAEPAAGTPRRPGQRPYAGRDDDPLTGEWSYSRGQDSARAGYEDYGATERSGRPYHDSELESGGRHGSAAARSPSGSWPEPDWDYEERGGRDQYASDPYPSDPYPSGQYPQDPYRPRSQGSTRSYKVSEPGSSSGERAFDEQESRRDPGPRRRADLDEGTSDRRSGRGRSQRDRRADERPGRSLQPERDDWAPREQPGGWPDGADELEPLPPLEDPGRRRAWPAEDGDWGRLDEVENPDPRWAEPLPEFEPEYEGDAW